MEIHTVSEVEVVVTESSINTRACVTENNSTKDRHKIEVIFPSLGVCMLNMTTAWVGRVTSSEVYKGCVGAK